MLNGVVACQLRAASFRVRAVRCLAGMLATVSIVLLLALVSYASDRFLVLPAGGRLGWLLALVGAAGIGLLWLAVRPCVRRPGSRHVAELVERQFPALGERLLTAVELSGSQPAGVSIALVDALQDETAATSRDLDFRKAVPSDGVRKQGTLLMLAMTAVAIQMITSPHAMKTWLMRILHPLADIPIYAHTRVWVGPGDIVMPRGDDVVLAVRTEGRPAREARLHVREQGGGWRSTTLKSQPAGSAVFSAPLRSVQQTTEYYAEANDGRSNAHTLRVEDRPTVSKVTMRLTYPGYTRRAPEVIEATAGNAAGVVGTRVEWEATTNKPVQRAQTVAEGAAPQDCHVAGTQVRGSYVIRADRTFSLRLVDRNGFEARPAPQYAVHALRDLDPSARISRPGIDLERAETGNIELRAAATDDYGVESMRWRYETGRRTGSLTLPTVGDRPTARLAAARIQLAPLRLRAGDTLAYDVEARDGDTVSGPHVGRSARYRVRIVGRDEMRERADARARAEAESLARLVRRQRELVASVVEARRSSDPAAPFRQIAAEQRSIAGQTAELARSVAQTSALLADNGIALPSELQERQAVQSALSALSGAKMPSVAQASEQAVGGGARAGERAAEAEWGARAVLDELKRLAAAASPPQTAQQMADRASALAEQQQQLADRSESLAERMDGQSSPSASDRQELDTIGRRQSEVRSETRALQADLDRAAREAGARGAPEAQAMRRSASAASAIDRPQSEAEQRLSSAQPGEASQRQSAAAAALRDVADRLSSGAGAPDSADSVGRAADALDAAADRLQQLTNREKAIQSGAQKSPAADESRRLGVQQEAIRTDLKPVIAALQTAPAAAESAQRAGELMQRAAQELGAASPADAVAPAREATRQLLQATQEALDAARRLRVQQDALEARQAVEQLARDQRALRDRTAAVDAALTRIPAGDRWRQTNPLADAQGQLGSRAWKATELMPADAFKTGLAETARRMEEARGGLGRQDLGASTRRSQLRAAQTLERLARSLGDAAAAARNQVQSGEFGTQEAKLADLVGELQILRELESQLHSETAGLDRRRGDARNDLTPDLQRDLAGIAQGQRHVQDQTRNMIWKVDQLPVSEPVKSAAKSAQEAREMLERRQTGLDTQSKERQVVGSLGEAVRMAQQALSEQQTRASRSTSRQGQAQRRAQTPSPKSDGQVVQPQPAVFGNFGARGRWQGALSPRAQQELRQGRQDRVPVEYRDLVGRYYRALSERAR